MRGAAGQNQMSVDTPPPPQTAAPPDRPPRSSHRAGVVGSMFGVLAAVMYTAANTALKEVATPGDFDWAIWITCLKAVPAAILAWAMIALDLAKGRPALPPRRLFVPLCLIGLLMQFGGNVLFQAALGLGGLALTVPLSFATLILSGAWLGRLLLGEPITLAAALATALMVGSVVFLSSGADAATTAITARSSLLLVAAAVSAAALAGAAYGIAGVFLRQYRTANVPLGATLVMPSTIGVVVLGIVSYLRLGPERIAQTTSQELGIMLFAGCTNAVAFFSVGAALARIPVNQLNLINASQAAMAAVAGVLFFHEPLTGGLAIGTLMTVAGLLVLGNEGRAARRAQLNAEVPHD